jgi:hypothetical protein
MLLMSCGGAVELVPRGSHGKGGPAPIEVSSLPKAARVEVIPLRRDSTCFWQDGHWDTRGEKGRAVGTWFWKPGSWVHTLQNCRYAPPQTTIENTVSGTRLLYTPGAYYATGSGQLCPPPPPCE